MNRDLYLQQNVFSKDSELQRLCDLCYENFFSLTFIDAVYPTLDMCMA